MSRTRMTTLAIILSELFPLDGFRCNFVSAPELENHLEYNHDTSQLCRTGYDNSRLHTFLSYFTLLVSDASVWNIIIILHSFVEQVMTMCRVQE